MFSQKELFDLAHNASTLQERLCGSYLPGEVDLWDRWKKIAAKGSEELFKRRLAIWQIDPLQAAAQPPFWAHIIQEWMERPWIESPYDYFKEKYPFQELLLPFLRIAHQQLLRSCTKT